MISAKFLKRSTLIGMLFLIAVVSYYLYRSSLPQFEFGDVTVLGTDADLQISRIHIVQNKKGVKEWELWADQAKVYQKRGITQMRNLHIRFFPSDGKKMDIYAQRGQMENRTRNVQLEDNVRIYTAEGYVMETDSLLFNSQKKYFSTKDRVVLRSRSFRLTGTGLIGRTDAGRFTLQQNVRAVIQDPAAAGLGGGAAGQSGKSGAPKGRSG